MSLWGLHKITVRKLLTDQPLHALQGALVLLPLLLMADADGAFLSGCVAGFWRELSQYRRSGSLNLVDRVLDILFFGIGASLAWIATLWML